eukprot:gene1482-32867_t
MNVKSVSSARQMAVGCSHPICTPGLPMPVNSAHKPSWLNPKPSRGPAKVSAVSKNKWTSRFKVLPNKPVKAFGWEDWDEHRSVMRFTNDMTALGKSPTLTGLIPPLINVFLVSTWVCSYETALQNGDLHALDPTIDWPNLSIRADGLFAIAASALSLLLVFRTNNSYDRWWEARTAWSETASECSHLGRQVSQWLPGSVDKEIRVAIIRWISAYPVALQAFSRGQDIVKELGESKQLRPEELELVASSPTPVMTVLNAIGHLAIQSNMKIESKTHIDESIRNLQAAFQTCEKIVQTPCPLSYTRHTVRFLVLWLTALPFSCWHELGWATVPVATLLAFLLLGIEEIGVQIEEPMGILALETYVSKIHDALGQTESEWEGFNQLFLTYCNAPSPPFSETSPGSGSEPGPAGSASALGRSPSRPDHSTTRDNPAELAPAPEACSPGPAKKTAPGKPVGNILQQFSRTCVGISQARSAIEKALGHAEDVEVTRQEFMSPENLVTQKRVVIGAVLAPLIIPAVIYVVGFGAGGIRAGSTAARMMSAHAGAVAAGSAVGLLQSVGAAGLSAGATAKLLLARKISPSEVVYVYYVKSLKRYALKSHLGKWLCATPQGFLQFRDKMREWELFQVEFSECPLPPAVTDNDLHPPTLFPEPGSRCIPTKGVGRDACNPALSVFGSKPEKYQRTPDGLTQTQSDGLGQEAFVQSLETLLPAASNISM